MTPYYDPMIAKIITSGADRPAAIVAMAEALAQIEVAGITTNLEFLKRVVAHPEFMAARTDTRFIERHGTALTEG